MPTLPYIHFQGQCSAALSFYKQVFGGTDLQVMHYGEEPGSQAEWQGSGRVLHGQITLGDGTLMASDYPPGIEGDPQKGFSVMHSTRDADEAQRIFALLMVGGEIINPMVATFFSPAFGMVRDRFGTAWIISARPAGDQK